MLLQLEIIVRIVSVIIMIIVPFIRLGNFVMRRYQKNQIADNDAEENDIVDTSGDDDAQEQENTILVDPVIAAMHQEEIDLAQPINDDHEQDMEVPQDQNKLVVNQDIEVIKLGSNDLVEDISSGDLGHNETSIESDILIIQDEQSQITDIIVTDSDTLETVEMIAIDLDGDGVVDEAVVIHTSPVDLAEAKRQRSIEMLTYELRSLKDKNLTSNYEKKLIEARSLHQDHYEFGVMLAEHYYENSEYRKSLGLYRGMLDADSTDDKSLWMIANCYIKLSEWDNAHVILEKLTSDKSDNPRYWMSLTEVYYHADEVDKAIECMRTTVKLRPTNMDYLSTLAQLYYESEQFDLYVPVLYRMLELDPLNHEIKSEIAKYA